MTRIRVRPVQVTRRTGRRVSDAGRLRLDDLELPVQLGLDVRAQAGIELGHVFAGAASLGGDLAGSNGLL